MFSATLKKIPVIGRVFELIFEHQKFGEKMRYIFVGGSCAVADLFFLYFLVDVAGIWYLYASVISFIMVGFFGYFGQKYFTFRNDSKSHKKQIMIFYIVSGIGLLINSLSMYFFVSLMGLWYLFGSIVTKFIVLIWNFTASKYITFRK